MNFSARFSSEKRMQHVIARAIICSIMLLVLPSCGIPHLRRPEPAPCLPPTFNGTTSSENSAQLGIDEFYNDPMLTGLIHQALAGNRELRILNEDVQIASNEILSRSGAYLPFLTVGGGAGLDRYSRFTLPGAGIRDDPYQPGKFLPNPLGNFVGGLNLSWQLDIYRQLRTARDAAGQRYIAAIERRNYFVTTLVAEIAENYYRLMALDKRLENLNQIIELQERSLEIAQARKEAARGTELPALRFQAEVQRNQSEKLIVYQDIVVAENRINFLVNRFPQPVERKSAEFYDLTLHALSVGVPSQLLLLRPDVRQAERELAAAGLDVYVARVNFFPQLVLNGGVGLQAFDVRHLFEPQAVIGNIAGGLVGPLVNKRAIRAQYLSANARQLQTIYNYQRVILNAFTEVINRMSMVEKYSNSIQIKKQQLASLEASVNVASDLFQNARTEYIDVLFAQRDLRDARTALIDTKSQQLSAIVNTYQALGGGNLLSLITPADFRGQIPYLHTVRSGETFRTISWLYYGSDRYCKALWAANEKVVPDPDRLAVGDKILILPIDQFDPALIEEVPAPAPPGPEMVPVDKPGTAPPPPPPGMPGPFSHNGPPDPAVEATGGITPPEATPKPATTGK
ncbi:MAG: TolC family protein [Isosphaeraceae bacterium]|nr:TolC family protein [Isosphaeraceae bacterium]